MSDDAKFVIINCVCYPIAALGALMLVAGIALKIYRSVNKQPQPCWGPPELLTVVGFFAFALPQIVCDIIDPTF